MKIYRSSEQGKEYIVRVLEENQFFGEMVLFKDEKLSSNAQALTECNLCVINKGDLEELVKDSSDLAQQLLTAFGERLKKAEQKLHSLALESAKEKTIRLLLNLAQEKSLSKQENVRIELPFNREGLADFLAITPETLSRKLAELQQEGLISIQGQKEVIIKNKNSLIDLL